MITSEIRQEIIKEFLESPEFELLLYSHKETNQAEMERMQKLLNESWDEKNKLIEEGVLYRKRIEDLGGSSEIE